MNRSLVAVVAVACSWSLASAQKVALTDGSERQVAVIDVAELLPENRGIPLPPKPAGRFAAAAPTSVQQLATFVRTFVPALREPGADIQALGESHLVLLGTGVQVAAGQRWLVTAQEPLGQFQVDVRVCKVTATCFDREVAPLLAKAADGGGAMLPTTMLDAVATTALVRALAAEGRGLVTQFPQVIVEGLHRAKLRVGKHIEYVRDFEIEVSNATFTPVPVKETLFDGHDVDVMVARIADGKLAVQMQLVDQVVELPLREVATTVPGSTLIVTVQVPRVTGCRGSMAVEMASGATALMAARRPDGSWLLTMMTPMEIQSGQWLPVGK